MAKQPRARYSLLDGLRFTHQVCKVCVFSRLGEDFRFVFPAMLVLSSIGIELFAAYIMTVISNFYLSISSNDRAAFLSCLWSSLFVVTVISVCVSLNKISIDACALQWREDLTAALQNDFLGTKRKSYSLLRGVDPASSSPPPAPSFPEGSSSHCDKPASSFDNPDQRIVQDPEKFANITARIIAKLVPLPAIIIYYTWYLWSLYGWVVPVSCYVYFAVSASITSVLTHRLVAVIYAQDKLEGDLRFFHARYRINAESIAFISGEKAELNKINAVFDKVCDNLRVLVVQRIPLYFFVTWFNYLGSIVNYAVIGFALLYMLNQEDMSEARAASLLAEGSYACLYLISAFSTMLDMSQKVSKLCGYSARIVELLKYVPPTIDDIDIQYMTDQDDNKNDASSAIRTSSSGTLRPSFCGRWGAALGSDFMCSCFAACSPTCELSRTRALMQRIFYCIQRQQKLSSNGKTGLLATPLSLENISSSDYATLSGDQPDDDGVFDKTLAAYNSSHGRVAFNNIDMHDSIRNAPSCGELCVAYFGPEEEEVAMQYRMLSGERSYCSINRPPTLASSQVSSALVLADPKEGDFMVEIRDLSVLLPLAARRGNYESAQATYAVSDLNMRIPCGMRLLVTGDSGCGKTTLLRVLCGLWSSKHGAGGSPNRGRVTFNCAKTEVMFLPQVSYYTEGSLEDNIMYPEVPEDGNSGASGRPSPRVASALSTIGLKCQGHESLPDASDDDMAPGDDIESVGLLPQYAVCRKRDVNASRATRATRSSASAFGTSLSTGELQKIGIGRVLYHHPKIVFLDESTSSLDEGEEARLYAEVLKVCDTIVSVGHRSSLLRFHTHELHLEGDGRFCLREIQKAPNNAVS